MSVMKWAMEDCFCNGKVEWHLPPGNKVTTIPTQPPNIFRGEKLVLFALLSSHDREVSFYFHTLSISFLFPNFPSYDLNNLPTRYYRK